MRPGASLEGTRAIDDDDEIELMVRMDMDAECLAMVESAAAAINAAG